MPTRSRYWAVRELHTENAVEVLVKDFKHLVLLKIVLGAYTLPTVACVRHDVLALPGLLLLGQVRVGADGPYAAHHVVAKGGSTIGVC